MFKPITVNIIVFISLFLPSLCPFSVFFSFFFQLYLFSLLCCILGDFFFFPLRMKSSHLCRGCSCRAVGECRLRCKLWWVGLSTTQSATLIFFKAIDNESNSNGKVLCILSNCVLNCQQALSLNFNIYLLVSIPPKPYLLSSHAAPPTSSLPLPRKLLPQTSIHPSLPCPKSCNFFFRLTLGYSTCTSETYLS